MKAEDQLYALQELLGEEQLTLDFCIASHCCCMSCWVYSFKDFAGNVVLEEDTLERLLEEAVKHFKLQI